MPTIGDYQLQADLIVQFVKSLKGNTVHIRGTLVPVAGRHR
jgi:hypothetical protein